MRARRTVSERKRETRREEGKEGSLLVKKEKREIPRPEKEDCDGQTNNSASKRGEG